jgi:hypothetical protein
VETKLHNVNKSKGIEFERHMIILVVFCEGGGKDSQDQ